MVTCDAGKISDALNVSWFIKFFLMKLKFQILKIFRGFVVFSMMNVMKMFLINQLDLKHVKNVEKIAIALMKIILLWNYYLMVLITNMLIQLVWFFVNVFIQNLLNQILDLIILSKQDRRHTAAAIPFCSGYCVSYIV